MLSVYGGKITTYRHLGEEAVDMLAGRMAALSGPAWTKTQPLPGGDFPIDGAAALQAELRARYPFLAETDAERLGKAYGTRAFVWLGQARNWADLGCSFGGGLSETEVAYLAREEWAQTPEDVLWRRSKLGLRLDAVQQDALAQHLAR